MAAVTLTKNNFKDEVFNSDQPVLIDFWAPWCAPCRMMSPVVDELARELYGKVKIGKVNIDQEHELAVDFNIKSIPTLLVIKNGKLAASSTGVRPKNEIIKMLEG